MPNIIGQFGMDEEVSMPVSFGVNEKGGMDDCEFTKYLRTAIMPLYPNAAPERERGNSKLRQWSWPNER